MPKKTTGKTHFIALKNYQNISHTEQMAGVNKNITQKALDFKYKSPELAGLLSIIPGLGYAYTGPQANGVNCIFSKQFNRLCNLHKY